MVVIILIGMYNSYSKITHILWFIKFIVVPMIIISAIVVYRRRRHKEPVVNNSYTSVEPNVVSPKVQSTN